MLKELIDKGDAAADRYKRLASGRNRARMKFVATPKLLADLREWVANTMDDVRLSRLYFAADSGLRLQSKTVTKADGDKIPFGQFKELVPTYLPVNPEAPSMNPDPSAEASLFQASLTALLPWTIRLKWNGVLIERGLFDKDGHYTIRGVVDSAAQNDGLAALLDKIAADSTPQYSDFITPQPTKPALDVIPMKELLDRVAGHARVLRLRRSADRVRPVRRQRDSDFRCAHRG